MQRGTIIEPVQRLRVRDVYERDLHMPTTWNGYLMSRDKLGIPLRQHMEGALGRLHGDTLLIDLQGVKELTTSVAEEIGPRYFASFLSARQADPELYTAYINARPEVAQGLRVAFEFWAEGSLSNVGEPPVALAFSGEGDGEPPVVLGRLSESLTALLQAIYATSGVTSPELETRGIKAASRKLSALVGAYPWLVRKTQRASEGDPRAWAYVYAPMLPAPARGRS